MTTTNNTTVKLMDAQLLADKNELTGKCTNKMIGVVLFNNLESQFTLWYDDYNYSKHSYSLDEIKAKMDEYTETFMTETETDYQVEKYNITLQGFDLKQLKTLGIQIDFSELYSKFKELRKENEMLYRTLWTAKAVKNYENSWYVKNCKLFNDATPTAIGFIVTPSYADYTNFDKKSNSEISYHIVISHKTVKKTFSLVNNFTAVSKWSAQSKFSGWALKESYNHLGLYKTTDGIIKRVKTEYENLKETVENKIKVEKASQTKIGKIKNIFGDSVQSVKETHYSGTGRDRYSYESEHFEVVFIKETKKNEFSNRDENFGTGIKFTTEDFKTFRILEIGGEFITGKMYQEFVNIIVNNFTFKKDVVITMNPMNNPINESGMKEMIEFIGNKLSTVELSQYTWKSTKM